MIRSLVIFLFFHSFLSGCVFPVRLADEMPFQNEEIGPLIVGRTTTKAVIQLFGEPEGKFSNGHWWVYHENRKMTEWLIVMCAGYGACGGDTLGGEVRQYSLILEFGDDELLDSFNVVNDDEPCGEAKSVCFVNGLVEIPNRSNIDLQLPAAHCAVAIFSHKPSSPRTAIDIRIDATEGAPIRLSSDSSFLFLRLPEGLHQLSVMADFLEGEFSAVEYLECTPGQTYYFEMSHTKMHEASFRLIDESTGRQEIEKRRLALVRDSLVGAQGQWTL